MRTSIHESITLAAATFIFTTTMSAADKGLTATKGGTDRSADQKSGFEKAFPTGRANTTGITKVANSTPVTFAESFMNHAIGPITERSRMPTRRGNTEPERRHSNQN